MAALIQLTDGVDGVTLRLENRISRIGRSADNDIVINDGLVSKYHAVIEARPHADGRSGFDYFLQDRASTNGCFVNDQRVGSGRLHQNDVIRLGVNHFRFIAGHCDDLTSTTQIQKTWIPGIYISRRKR
ncbi:MAG: FHA domain-containing protein [Gammaproteobacteria bacterium]|nr:FHA domain-containing protein [Gammaproteobacteria bacterium]